MTKRPVVPPRLSAISPRLLATVSGQGRTVVFEVPPKDIPPK